MATQVRLRRGTTSDHSGFTGAAGEITIDTDKDVAVVHDGSTAGGFPMTRSDRGRGYTKIEHFTAGGTWTKNNKPDLKRIEVYAFGGGGSGNNTSGGGGGGSGGQGYVVLETSAVTSNVAVTIGGGANSAGGSGGATSFGSYITANGGAGAPGSNLGVGAAGGNATGSSVIDMGAFSGGGGAYSATANANFGWVYGYGGGPGGRPSGATGVSGGAAGAAQGGGADGSVIIYEIYGEY